MNQNVKKYIKELREINESFDFSKLDDDPSIAKGYISAIAEFTENETTPLKSERYPTGNKKFYRAVNYKKKNEKYTQISDFWYPPSGDVKWLGRCNFKKQQVFYCSDHPGTSLFEIKPSGNNEIIALITLKIRRDLNLIAFGTKTIFESSIDPTITDKEIALKRFFREKFLEDIPYHENYLYFPTAAIANLFLPNDEVDGFIFPSLASNLKGENIVLKPNVIDSYQSVLECRVFEVESYMSQLNFKVRCKSFGDNIVNGEIDWRGTRCDSHSLDESVYH